MVNNINFDSYFDKTVIDNNGNTVTDINAGLDNLFAYFNNAEYNLTVSQSYLVSEYEEGYPDLVAYRSILGSQQYWWWVLLLNKLDDSFTDIKYNWVYSINDAQQINSFIENSTEANTSEDEDRLGKIVELN